MGLLSYFGFGLNRKSPQEVATDLANQGDNALQRAFESYDQGRVQCEPRFLEAFRYFQQLQAKEKMARCALGLGRTYLHIRGLRELSKAKHWYEVALEFAEIDATRAQALGSLALWELQQLEEESTASEASPSRRDRLDTAEALARDALGLMPECEYISRAVTYSQLAQISMHKGDLPGALYHQEQALAEYRADGDGERVAGALLNLSSGLAGADRLADAMRHVTEAIAELDRVPPFHRTVDWQSRRDLAVGQQASLLSAMKGAPEA